MVRYVVTSDEDFHSLQSDWNALHREANGKPFQSFDWLFSWWRVYRDLIRMQLLVVRDGDRLVGVAPFFVEERGKAGFRLRRLRMMGEYEVSGDYEPLFLESALDGVVAAASTLLARLLREKVIDIADFHHFTPGSPFFTTLASHAESERLLIRREDRSAVHLVLRPPRDWRSYGLMLTRHDRQLRARNERLLFKNGAELEALPGTNDPRVLEDFIRLHSNAMAARSIGGHFVSKERFGAFLKRLSDASGASLQTGWFFLKKGSQRFAALLAFYSNEYCCLYLTGRDSAHELSRYGPGIVLMNMVIRDAIGRGCRVVDLGEGGTPYKYTMGATDEGFARLTIARGRFVSVTVALYLAVVAFHHCRLWKERLEPFVQQWRFRLSRRHSPSSFR